MEWKNNAYTLTTDPGQLDMDYTFAQLSQTYWASTRSRGQMETAIKNSITFVLLHSEMQIGFGRAVTDKAVMAYLADVFIDKAHRGKGLGKWLVSCVLEHPDLTHCKIILETADAHSLYEKNGFQQIEAMRRNPDIRFGE